MTTEDTSQLNGTAPMPTSAAAAYEAKLAKLRAARKPIEDAEVEKRRARDVAELDKVFDALAEIGGTWEDNVVRLPDSPAELPGHLVLKRPQPSATRQFKATIVSTTKLDPDRGSQERRINVNKTYVLNCLAYPSVDDFTKLCEVAAGVPETAVKTLHRLADLGAQDEGKE